MTGLSVRKPGFIMMLLTLLLVDFIEEFVLQKSL